jgi:hypothetical protein
MYILYKTTNTISGRYYVGVTNNNDKYYKGSGTALLEAIKKYGSKNFIKEVLETFETEEEAFAAEAKVVNEEFVKDRNTYNIKVGGKGGTGQLKTEAHKQKIREARAKQTTTNGGRKPAMDPLEFITLCNKLGKRKAAEELQISLTACRSRYHRLKNQV